MSEKKPNVIYFEEKIRRAHCLHCNYIFTPRVENPKRCPNCQARLLSKEMLKEIGSKISVVSIEVGG